MVALQKNPKLTSEQWIALICSAILIGFSLWSAGGAVAKAINANASLEAQEASVERLEKAVKLRVSRQNDATQEEKKSPFLLATNRSLAAAELQALLNARLADLNVSPISTDIQFPDNQSGLPSDLKSVELKLSVQVSEGNLPALLDLLETGFPVLILEEFSIERDRELQSKSAPIDRWQNLDVVFRVSGYWQAKIDG